MQISEADDRSSCWGSWARAAGLAALSGSRTTLGLAFTARSNQRWRRARPLTLALAAGELLADKLPGIPDRTAALPLVGRALAGGTVALASRPTRGWGSALFAAALGASAAVAAAMITFQLRRQLTRGLGGRPLANLVAGAVEDGLVIAAGRALSK